MNAMFLFKSRKISTFLILSIFSFSISFAGNDKDKKDESGSYTLYYENGTIQEQGKWVDGKNLGEFVRYYENGIKSQEFYFDKNGNRSGIQSYYYNNGNPRMVGNWKNGRESGIVIFYNEDGTAKQIKKFDNGNLVSVIDEDIILFDFLATLAL